MSTGDVDREQPRIEQARIEQAHLEQAHLEQAHLEQARPVAATELVFTELPEDELLRLPPGAELAALLAGLDPVRYTGTQLAVLLSAQHRQLCHDQGRMLATVRELAYAPRTAAGAAAPVRDREQNPFTAVEMSFALTWTEYTSELMVCLAMLAVDTVPALGEAMAAGRLDLDKLKVISAELELIEDVEQMRQIVAHLLPEVEHETTAQIRQRVRRLIVRTNPEAVRRRHAKAVADRWVEHHEYANGTSCIAGSYLPKDKAAAAFDHIDAIARATRATGDPLGRTLDQLRADIFADLLAGVDPGRAGAATPAPRKGVVNLSVDLTTLACLSEQPGEIAGFGEVIASIARQTAAQIAQISQWRFTVTDGGEVWAEGPLSPATTRGLVHHLTRWGADGSAGSSQHADHTRDTPGRARYRPSAAQTAFVRARDKTCRAPGCRRIALRCEIDHVRDWARGGPTVIDNLCCLCKRHHRAKHVGGYQFTRGLYGIDWQTPLGLRYTVVPDIRAMPTPLEYAVSHHIQGHNPGQLRR